MLNSCPCLYFWFASIHGGFYFCLSVSVFSGVFSLHLFLSLFVLLVCFHQCRFFLFLSMSVFLVHASIHGGFSLFMFLSVFLVCSMEVFPYSCPCLYFWLCFYRRFFYIFVRVCIFGIAFIYGGFFPFLSLSVFLILLLLLFALRNLKFCVEDFNALQMSFIHSFIHSHCFVRV